MEELPDIRYREGCYYYSYGTYKRRTHSGFLSIPLLDGIGLASSIKISLWERRDHTIVLAGDIFPGMGWP